MTRRIDFHPGLTYAAREDVPISSATLKLIRTLRVIPGKLCKGDPSSPSPTQLSVPVQIIASSINVDLINLEGSGKSPATSPLPWPTFGNTVPEISAVEQATLAAMGIAIASPYLMLTGGERTISVTFMLATFSETLTTTLNELCRATGSEQGPVAMEAGTHSIWISEQLQELGHEVIVANVRELRAISHSDRKSDQVDAEKLARYARLDPNILRPIAHRTVEQQQALTLIRARALLVRLRTAAVNAVRGLTKSCGYRIRHRRIGSSPVLP